LIHFYKRLDQLITDIMGRKGGKKPKQSGGSALDSLGSEFSDLFKTLPPIKRSELTKVVEKLFQVSSNLTSEPTTPAKQWEEFVEISSLVEKVRTIESGHSMCRTLPDRKNAIKPFLAWLSGLGAVISGVEVGDYGDQGLGLRVAKDIKEGEEVIRIPQKAMMSVDTAKSSSIGTLIERDPLLQTMPNVVLAVHLLIERNSPASIWEPYINTLPHSYTTVLYFTPTEMEELKGSPAMEDALKQYKFVARQYAYFYRLFANTMLKDYLTYDEYRWAVSTVMTRQNLVPGKETSSAINSLIPFWDLANHDNGQLSTDFDPDTPATVCLAQKDFSQGEQFTIFYGVRANCDLLIHNGFVFADNQTDCLTVRLGVAKTDPLAASRLALLERLGVNSQKFYLRRTEEPLDKKLVAFLRVLQMEQAAIQEYQDKDIEESRKLLDLEVSTQLDGKVMQYMITRAALLLRAYPTTLEQDQAILKESKDSVILLCCQLRMAEKRILVNTVAYCEQMLKKVQAD